MKPPLDNRRPLKSRDTGWAKAAAAGLAKSGVSPDAVSAGGLGFALIGAAAFVLGGVADGAERLLALLLAAGCIQLRLLCNLLDGLVAVEHGKAGPYGPIWNEAPDRASDALFLVGAGYGGALMGIAWAEAAGWLAALAAVATAYVRELGRGMRLPADFCGPGAKPQRMAILTCAAVVAAAEPLWGWRGQSLAAGLALIAILALVTVGLRIAHMAEALRARRKA